MLPGTTPTEVHLVYHVTEGKQVEVAKVLTTGYQYTRPGIIARQVTIQPNGPLRDGDVAKTQRQLYNLGVFSRVQIAPQNPDGTDPEKTVIVSAQEGDRYTIGYGFGFEVQRIAGGSTNPNGTTLGASPRGIFEIARGNMFGRAQTLSFKARASTLEYRFALGYTADNFLANRRLSLQLTGFADETQDINTFTSTRYQIGTQLVQKLSPSSSLLYQYFYRRVEASNLVSTINPEQIPLLSQPTLVSGFGVTYARDRRDNPADAKHGSFNTVDVSDAIEAIGSGASFFRGFFQNSSFYSIGRAFVFARSVRFGIEIPYGNTVEGDETFNPSQCTAPPVPTDTSVIPLPERFFAGGGTSLRGFGLNQAGPRDPMHRFSRRWACSAGIQSGAALPDEIAIRGNPPGRDAFLRWRKCVHGCKSHFAGVESAITYRPQLLLPYDRIWVRLPKAALDLRARLLAAHHGLDPATPEPGERILASVPNGRLVGSAAASRPACSRRLLVAGSWPIVVSSGVWVRRRPGARSQRVSLITLAPRGVADGRRTEYGLPPWRSRRTASGSAAGCSAR